MYGVGTIPFDNDGLGKGTFAHGAASNATIRIDPEHDMVIVMTRNAAGTNFNTYFPKFMKAVAAGLQDASTPTRTAAER